MRHTAPRAPRGISLIEALVAMAVMAFGMLGVVGMQATLRANADLSKQRTEAMRIAQERMEDLRNFSVLATTPGSKAFADKATFGTTTVTGYTTNTTFTVSGTVAPAGAAPDKTLSVTVTWTDRTGTAQDVRLMSAMANIAPELGASMIVSSQGAGGVREPEGRRRGIPPQAKNFGDGTSGFRPPQPTGNVAWVFNNVTGLITSVCTTSAADNASLTLASLSGCVTTQAYQLISGYIRFATGMTQPTATAIADPTDGPGVTAAVEAEVVQTLPAGFAGTKNCFHGYAATYVEFFCPLPVQSPTPATWSGTLQVKASSLGAVTLSPNLADAVQFGRRKVCRYRALVDPVPNPIYQNVNAPLANENLVLIRPGDGTTPFTCPNPPTRAHQPAT